jgi:hypothetical protein|tara:strand:- start:126 stop:425 length:300 start_codon:yes stop_codon:yes gene_type:complete
MTNDRQISDLKIERKECEKCGATWINGKHVFRGTAASYQNSELDLAGLVCNKYGNHQCINPMKGESGGQTWEYRSGYIDGKIEERKNMIEQLSKNLDDI